MARGWESKSVESQIEESQAELSARHFPVSPEERQTAWRKQNLLLSRKRILQQLERNTDPRYGELLRRTLAALDEQIATLA
ncbi:MAG TPA: hypothetical protein VL240_02965 [Candidatus Binatia bacterium]|nr:hypothetical protein [Candidatus Binatia bacterium]